MADRRRDRYETGLQQQPFSNRERDEREGERESPARIPLKYSVARTARARPPSPSVVSFPWNSSRSIWNLWYYHDAILRIFSALLRAAERSLKMHLLKKYKLQLQSPFSLLKFQQHSYAFLFFFFFEKEREPSRGAARIRNWNHPRTRTRH